MVIKIGNVGFGIKYAKNRVQRFFFYVYMKLD